MSHYAVAVFDNYGEFNRLLAPYNENNRDYFVFHPVKYKEMIDRFDKFREQNEDWTLDMFIDCFGYIRRDGQWGYENNPNGYWDFYTLNGRSYLYEPVKGFELPEGQYEYRKNDINWYPDMEEARAEAEEFWDEFVEGKNDEIDNFMTRDFYLKRYQTREQYIRENTRVIPYAFITPDGEWHSPGRVGYFGLSDETADKWNEYAREWDDWLASSANPFVNFVDCHI